MSAYVRRPAIDDVVLGFLRKGTGTYAIEGPAGAGKSAALCHALVQEVDARSPKARGFVRLVQLYGDEAPSLFSRRLLREVSALHLVSYPEPERLRVLLESMNVVLPGVGKLLAALVPEDLRPLHQATTELLAELGRRAVAVAEGGPLVLGVDLLGGTVSAPMRDFFSRLRDDLPPSVVLLIAQPGGDGSALCQVAAERRVLLGPLRRDEAEALVRAWKGKTEAPVALEGLLPGDIARLAAALPEKAAVPEMDGAPPRFALSMALFERQRFEAAVAQGGAAAQAADLVAWVAVAARPDAPLGAGDAARLLGLGDYQASGGALALWALRRHELVQAQCTTALDAQSGPELATALTAGWPLLPRHQQVRVGVIDALARQGVLGFYQRRLLQDLLGALRAGQGSDGATRAAALRSGVQALRLLLELVDSAQRSEAPFVERSGGRVDGDGVGAADDEARGLLGQAVAVLAELEQPLWRAGWHRTFAELYDALRPRLGEFACEAAPALWFRRARARVQAVDWSQATGGVLESELDTAEAELGDLLALDEERVRRARLALGLSGDVDLEERALKARQARGYVRVLGMLRGGYEARRFRAALDDILVALAAFSAPSERLAQTLTILGDAYSAVAVADPSWGADELARWHYARAVTVAMGLPEPPLFALGVIHRSRAAHEARMGRHEAAQAAFADARRCLLRSPDAAMGSLLAALLP